MELRIVAAAARRRALAIALLAVVAALVSVIGASSLTTTYRASATLLLDPTAVLVPGQQVAVGDPERYVDSQLRVLSSAALAEQAAASVPRRSAEDIRGALQLVQITGSDVVDVAAEAGTPEDARDMANAVADAYVAGRAEESTTARASQVEALDAQIAALGLQLQPSTGPEAASVGQGLLADQIADLQTQRNALALPTATQDRTAVLDPATAPASSEAPSSLVVGLAGGLAGLLAGTVLATLREARQPHVMGATDSLGVLGVPAVTEFTIGRDGRRGRRAAGADVVRPHTGALRPATTLAATVTGTPAARSPRRLAVCGTTDPVGSWPVASELAVVLARQGARVALVALTPGATLAAPDSSPDAAAGTPGQDVAAPGTQDPGADPGWRREHSGEPAVTVWSPRTSGLLPTGHAVRSLLENPPADCDVVILQAPPVLQSPLVAQVAADLDGLVLTVVAGSEREADLELAHRTLAGTGVRLHPVMLRRPGRQPALRRR